MSIARNIVLSGKYKGKSILEKVYYRSSEKKQFNYLIIEFKKNDYIILNETNIKDIQIIYKDGVKTDIGSSILSGALGGILLGSAGLVAGAGMGEQSSLNLIQIIWIDEQKSLVKVDDSIAAILNTILWNIKNNFAGEKLTKDEIENDKKGCRAGCFIFILFWLALFLFDIFMSYSPQNVTEKAIQAEHLEYINYCAERARNNTENYIDCMNKRPDIR